MITGKLGIEDFVLNESYIRFVLGKPPEDEFNWASWINKHPEVADTVLQAKEIIAFISARHVQPNHPEISERVFRRVQKQIYAEKHGDTKIPQKKIFSYYWYAASVVLLTGLTLIWLSTRKTNPPFLTENLSVLEVIVPQGQKSQLVLPDGSKVWLNGGSQLNYPVNFLESSREVWFSGEGYFDVTRKHNNPPFIVHLKDNFDIKVLGTEFNLKAYEEDKVVEATLVNGSIRLIQKDGNNHVIRELRLKPNEKVVYEKEKKYIKISELESETQGKRSDLKVFSKIHNKPLTELETITGWKNNEFVFQDEPFESIALRMERWFGMKITIEDESLKWEQFTGKFVNNESIYQILEIFNRSESIEYTTREKEIIITKRKKNTNH